MPSMVASSIARAADDVGDAAEGADDRDGAPLPHARLPTMAVVAISAQENIEPFRALKAVASLTPDIVLGRDAAVNSFRDAAVRGIMESWSTNRSPRLK
jgi:hypothetical protein